MKNGTTSSRWCRLPNPEKASGAGPSTWIVERTFGWFNQSRRLCRDYEVGLDHSEAMIRICMTRLMVKRLARVS